MVRVNVMESRKRFTRRTLRGRVRGRGGRGRTYRGQQGWLWTNGIESFTATGAEGDTGVFFTLLDGETYEDEASLKEAKAVSLTRLIGQLRLNYLPIVETFPAAAFDVWIARVSDKLGDLWNDDAGAVPVAGFVNLPAYDIATDDFHVLHWRTMWATSVGGMARFSPASDPTEVALPGVASFPPVEGQIIALNDFFGRSVWDFDFNANWGMSDEQKVILGITTSTNELLATGAAMNAELTTRQLVRKHR